jgi:hypothetical protein
VAGLLHKRIAMFAEEYKKPRWSYAIVDFCYSDDDDLTPTSSIEGRGIPHRSYPSLKGRGTTL